MWPAAKTGARREGSEHGGGGGGGGAGGVGCGAAAAPPRRGARRARLCRRRARQTARDLAGGALVRERLQERVSREERLGAPQAPLQLGQVPGHELQVHPPELAALVGL